MKTNNRLKSLGAFRKANKTKPRSPDLIGQLHLNATHCVTLLNKLEKSTMRKFSAI